MDRHEELTRLKVRLLGDLFKAVEDLDLTATEVWKGIEYFAEAGATLGETSPSWATGASQPFTAPDGAHPFAREWLVPSRRRPGEGLPPAQAEPIRPPVRAGPRLRRR